MCAKSWMSVRFQQMIVLRLQQNHCRKWSSSLQQVFLWTSTKCHWRIQLSSWARDKPSSSELTRPSDLIQSNISDEKILRMNTVFGAMGSEVSECLGRIASFKRKAVSPEKLDAWHWLWKCPDTRWSHLFHHKCQASKTQLGTVHNQQPVK